MGRKRSELICPECGKQCFKRTNPVGFVHYDHKTKRRKTHYPKSRFSPQDPPNKFQGESKLYNKLGNMSNHFHKIGDYLEDIQRQVYKYKPTDDVSTQAVEDLDLFEKKFLNIIEKILTPYYDKRWATNWTGWFKIQMDSMIHGPRRSGIINATPFNDYYEKKVTEDGNIIRRKVTEKRPFTSLQVKKQQLKTYQFAIKLINSHPLNKALNLWASHDYGVSINGIPEESKIVRKLPDNEIERKSRLGQTS